jgi:Tol biopolymer transport system component
VLDVSGDESVWVWDLARGTRARLSAGSSLSTGAGTWSPDDRTLYFARTAANGLDELDTMPADGSEAEHTLVKADTSLFPVERTRDGKWLLYGEVSKDGSQNAALKAFPLVPGAQPFTVLESVLAYRNVRLRPPADDWLAYESDESGRAEIYLTRFPKVGARYQVSKSGGSQPVWSRDGKKLFYLGLSNKLNYVEVTTAGDSVQLSEPRGMFQTAIRSSIPIGAYDVAADGRFIMVNSVAESTAPVVLVTNWEAEVKK